MAEREREIFEAQLAKNDVIRSIMSNEFIDIDFPSSDEELLRYVGFAVGTLLLVCSVPCLCIFCCCCRSKRIAGE